MADPHQADDIALLVVQGHLRRQHPAAAPRRGIIRFFTVDDRLARIDDGLIVFEIFGSNFRRIVVEVGLTEGLFGGSGPHLMRIREVLERKSALGILSVNSIWNLIDQSAQKITFAS